MDNDVNDDILKLKYLFNVSLSSSLPEKIRNVYSNLGVTISSWNKINIGRAKSKVTMCEHCDAIRTTENCIYKVSPKISPGPAMRRILQKIKKKKRLSTIEKKLALRLHSGNTVVITCLVCHKKSKIPVSQHSSPKPEIQEIKGKKKNKNNAKKRVEEAVNAIETSATKTDRPETPVQASSGLDNLVSNISELSPNECIVLDSFDSRNATPIYNVSRSLFKSSTPYPSNLTNDFIPLGSSSPKEVVKKRKSSLLANPYCNKKTPDATRNLKGKKLRVSALQQVLKFEQSLKTKKGPRLKDFLNVL